MNTGASGRRRFLQLATAAAVAGASRSALPQTGGPRIRALAFDGFPVFDPRPVAALAESLYPGRGAALMEAWRTRQFEYQWLRALGGKYVDFLAATRHALGFALAQTGLPPDPARQQQLMAVWSDLKPWPDAVAALQAMRGSGLRLAFLSNMTEPMLAGGLRNAGLGDAFEAVISTHRIATYKPDPRAYQLGVDVLGLPREQILFVAFAGWDMAGAKWFGYPVFWMNRGNARAEQLSAEPDGMGVDMAALARFLEGANRGG